MQAFIFCGKDDRRDERGRPKFQGAIIRIIRITRIICISDNTYNLYKGARRSDKRAPRFSMRWLGSGELVFAVDGGWVLELGVAVFEGKLFGGFGGFVIVAFIAVPFVISGVG